MRLLYVTAIGVAGTALIASPLMRPLARTPEPAPPASVQQRVAAAVEASPPTHPSAVRVVDEFVTAEAVAGTASQAASQQRHARPRLNVPPPRRSLLARVFFGTGEHRPRPFPHPGW